MRTLLDEEKWTTRRLLGGRHAAAPKFFLIGEDSGQTWRMTFQAYLDTIKAKTGKTPEDFRALAREKGLLEPGVKPAQIIEWAKEDFSLGHGHAMAIVAVLGQAKGAGLVADEKVDAQFTGKKAQWRPLYERVLESARGFGEVSLAPTNSYVSLLKNGKKFAIVQPTADRLDVGVKLAAAEPTERFEAAGSWNTMVTHRVRLSADDQLDAELVDWLKRAYDAA
jgi:hypothetical protein